MHEIEGECKVAATHSMIKKNILQDIKPITRKIPLNTQGGSSSSGFNQTSTPVSAPAPRKEEMSAPKPAPLDTNAPVFTVPRQSLPREVPFEPREPGRSSRYALWYIAVACIIGFLFSLSFLFEHATITVTPKVSSAVFDATDSFTAKKDSADPEAIVYTEMSLSGDESMKLPSTSTKTESVSATGTVVLYNTYSNLPYKLVKGTRLATADGKIYKIDNAVTIPGYKKVSTTTTPGSIEVTVTAAVAGDASNIDKSDFTVPGLAGTPQAKTIYGRTKTAISGGLSGTIYSIAQDAANAALGTLQTKLKATLIAKAKVQVPDGYIFYEGATTFVTDESVKAPYSKTEDVPLALHGTLTAYLIKEDTLVKAVAKKFISQYNGEPVKVPKIGSLALDPDAAMNPKTDTSFSFSLSGTANIVWVVDPNNLKGAFVNRKKADFQAILGSQTGIDKAQVVIKPFWKQSFPKEVKRITVTVTEPSS